MAVTTADPPPKPARGSETILLVEDEPEVRRFAFHVLTKYGYRTLDAAHADEALAVCERHPGPVHLLLTDIVLPGLNGCELAARLLRTRPQAKVLYMSGYTDQAITAVAGVDAGLQFLAKPFTPDALATRVRQVLGERSAKPTILVVDDEASIRKLLHKILETAGYAVLEAANGREALHRVRQRPVDVMLTDLIMPEKEGLETIRELRAQYPAVRVVAMSGAFDRRYLKTAAMMGAQATLKKPIAPDELLRVLDKVMLGKK
jgi:CheY-like chemotaxis protein